MATTEVTTETTTGGAPQAAAVLLTGLLQPWHDAVADPAKSQREVLHRLQQTYAQTGCGKQHNASQIETVEGYRRAFPIPELVLGGREGAEGRTRGRVRL